MDEKKTQEVKYNYLVNKIKIAFLNIRHERF